MNTSRECLTANDRSDRSGVADVRGTWGGDAMSNDDSRDVQLPGLRPLSDSKLYAAPDRVTAEEAERIIEEEADRILARVLPHLKAQAEKTGEPK